ncbi:hypothetical protein H0Z60_19250 [Ectothiorhodospiraceae bacterium WFHF3C12]|nr:hypothetical protein [Ectothiorhodospiraceae bacterium WFHF3C12]
MTMSLLERLRAYWGRALIIGLANAVLLSAIMVPVIRSGISPLPQAPSHSFAEAVLGQSVPLPIGLLFHVVYVTFWSMAFVVVAYPRFTLARALGLGLVLWVGALAVFFPINGWGFLGLSVGPQLIGVALVPHLLFSAFLYGLSRLAFGRR